MNISWMYISSSDLLFWGGVALMAISALMAAASVIVFGITGRKLKRRLELEYGKQER